MLLILRYATETCSSRVRNKTADSPELDTGRINPRVGSGRVGSGRVQIFSLRSGSGRVGSGPFVWVCVGHPGLYKMLR